MRFWGSRWRRVAFAPGRVNLIGDHTDYTGGLVLPMAIDLGTTVELDPGGDTLDIESADLPDDAAFRRIVQAMADEGGPGFTARGRVTTTLPIGAGLSSSAALEVSLALAFGFVGTPTELALTCQEVEQAATGVPSGVMDQMASACGVEGHALLLDCTDLSIVPVAVPDGVDVVVVHSGQQRALAESAYAERRAACETAAGVIGPLRSATAEDVATIRDPVIRKRARHVVTENARVRAFARALDRGDVAAAGVLMIESHESLRDDFGVSTQALDELVAHLVTQDGVHGARLTGAGFGGCAVALCDSGALGEGWTVKPSAGARLLKA